MPLVPIYTRSPRFISQSGTEGQKVRLELFIWNAPSTLPIAVTRELDKPIPSSTVTEVHFDISPFIRSYINFTTHADVTSEVALPVAEYAYCTALTYLDDVLQTTDEFICFDGYGMFMDGSNPTVEPTLHDAGTYFVEGGNSDEGSIVIFDSQVDTLTIRYTDLVTGDVTTESVTNIVSKFPNVHANYILNGNRVDIFRGVAIEKTMFFNSECEVKYDIVKCDFVNGRGVWKRINFFKASNSKFTMSNKEFNLMPASINYSTDRNIRQTFNTNGKDSISCNTGWVNDGFGHEIKQLLLSQEIRLDDVPVGIKSKGTDLRKGINDQNINYKIDFDYSFSTLNYVV